MVGERLSQRNTPGVTVSVLVPSGVMTRQRSTISATEISQ